MKKRILFIIIIFCNLVGIRSQNNITSNNINKFDLHQNVDSVVISYEVSYDKETSSDFVDASDFPSFKRSMKLNKKEVNTLKKYLLLKTSYSNDISGLSQSDIYIYYYRNESIEKTIAISSISRNINFIINDDLTQKGISIAFENYLTSLLRKKGIWTKTKIFEEF